MFAWLVELFLIPVSSIQGNQPCLDGHLHVFNGLTLRLDVTFNLSIKCFTCCAYTIGSIGLELTLFTTFSSLDLA